MCIENYLRNYRDDGPPSIRRTKPHAGRVTRPKKERRGVRADDDGSRDRQGRGDEEAEEEVEEKRRQKTKEKKGKGRTTERNHEKRDRFLLVALSPGCRVILPYYYPLLMPAALCRGEEYCARDERKRARRNKIDGGGRPQRAGRKMETLTSGASARFLKSLFSDRHDARCLFLFSVSLLTTLSLCLLAIGAVSGAASNLCAIKKLNY